VAHLPRKIAAGLMPLLALAGCSALSSGASSGPAKSTDRIVSAEEIGIDPEEVVGPYPSIDDYCADLKREKRRCAGSESSVEDGFEPPYEAVELLRVKPRGTGSEFCEIAIATVEGWFITDELFICGEASSKVETEVMTLELVTQKDGPPIVRAELRTQYESKGAAMMSESLVLCGIGPSGAVSCTAPFARLEHVLHPDGTEEHRAISMTLSRFGVLKVNGKTVVDGRLEDVSGAYRIRFP
jgi:hypothetical protein